MIDNEGNFKLFAIPPTGAYYFAGVTKKKKDL